MNVFIKGTIFITLLESAGAINICMAKTGFQISGGHGPIFKVNFSEPLAVLNFLNHLSSNALPKDPFKQLFNGSRFNEPKYQLLMAEFDKLNIDYNYDFEDYPRGEQIGLSTASLLKKRLIDSRSMDEFKASAMGIIPNESLFKLVQVLTEFTPVYQELIYQPNKEKFEQQLDNFRKLITSTDVASYFNDGIKFYNSSWDNSVPFNFLFYP